MRITRYMKLVGDDVTRARARLAPHRVRLRSILRAQRVTSLLGSQYRARVVSATRARTQRQRRFAEPRRPPAAYASFFSFPSRSRTSAVIVS